MATSDNHESDELKVDYWKNYLQKMPELSEKFEILEKVGEGAFAAVFVVRLNRKYKINEKFALKFMIPVVKSNRIVNEIKILNKVGGKYNVINLHYNFRIDDKTFLVMDYVEHKRFSEYYLLFDENETKEYIKNLLIALKHIYKFKIIHRDIKPDNFLYDRKRKKYALVDFGLSHSEGRSDFDENISNKSNFDSFESTIESKPKSDKDAKQLNCICGDRFSLCDGCRSKPVPNAKRGGTMGYRAPEVIMGCEHQTGSLDVWAAGIILACIFVRRYPLLRGDSDMANLVSITRLVSLERMDNCADNLERHIIYQNDKSKSPEKSSDIDVSTTKENIDTDNCREKMPTLWPLHHYHSKNTEHNICDHTRTKSDLYTCCDVEYLYQQFREIRLRNLSVDIQLDWLFNSPNLVGWFELLSGLLEPNFHVRLSASDALKLSLFKDVHKPRDNTSLSSLN